MSDEMTVALVSKSIKRTLDMFEPSEGFVRSKVVGEDFDAAQRAKIACRTASEYSLASTKMQAPPPNKSECSSLDHPLNRQVSAMMSAVGAEAMERVMMGAAAGRTEGGVCGGLVLSNPSSRDIPSGEGGGSALVVARRKPADAPEPDWHAPWKLQSVVSSHLGWVRAVAFDPGNEWFVTGSNDRTIKVWDLAKCCVGAPDGLKLTLTGHIHSVRGLAISHRHPYMFSAGEDKKVMCWDLEYNRVIRQYHGHLSAVFTLKLHPTLDVLVTAGRDSAARVWDIRTKQQVHVLASHTDAVGALAVNATDPQIITGSHDCTIKLWDLAAGKVMTTLTHHKKAIRAIAVHDQDEFSFVSAAADNLKKWQARDGLFLHNLKGHSAIVNTLALNDDKVLFSGADNGSMTMWDYKTGYPFQTTQSLVQPGSLDAEAGIYASSFDMTGSRLITGEADKTIKIWQEDDNATPETHPVDMRQWTKDYHARRR